jgi:hypothetical protein
MSDPSKLDTSDWFSAIVAGVVAGFGAFAAMFTRSKAHIYKRIDTQEARMDAYDKISNDHSTQLAVIHTNQDHMSNRLDEIRKCGEETNRKLDRLLERKS